MTFLKDSLIELITQTSTNLPPDVRAAMGVALGNRNGWHASFAGTGHHRFEYRYGAAGRGAHLPGHGYADVRGAYAGGRESIAL